MSRVVLTGDDVDALCRVAPFAEKGSNARYRPALTWVYARSGLAFATDSYRLAYTEVDCDDVTIPARAVEWLPLDGCTLNIDRKGRAVDVWWDDNGQRVGDSYVEPETYLTVEAIATISRGGTVYDADRWVSDEPRWTCNDRHVGKVATIACPGDSLVYLRDDFLRQCLKMLKSPRVAIDNPLRPVRFFDDDLTVILMPIRPQADMYVSEAS